MRRRDRLADAAWTQLCFLGAISPASPDFTTTAPAALSGNSSGSGGAAAGGLDFDAKEADVVGGLKRLAAVSVSFVFSLPPSPLSVMHTGCSGCEVNGQ